MTLHEGAKLAMMIDHFAAICAIIWAVHRVKTKGGLK